MSLRGEVTGVKIGNLTEEGLDPADHLFGAEGFGDVTHGADLSSSQNVGGKTACGEHDDRQVLSPGIAAQTLRQVETIGRSGESDVEEYQIHVLLTQEALGILGGWRLESDVALPAEFEGQNPPDMRLIFDNQNSAPHDRQFTTRES